jgi:hypothetical protein
MALGLLAQRRSRGEVSRRAGAAARAAATAVHANALASLAGTIVTGFALIAPVCQHIAVLGVPLALVIARAGAKPRSLVAAVAVTGVRLRSAEVRCAGATDNATPINAPAGVGTAHLHGFGRGAAEARQRDRRLAVQETAELRIRRGCAAPDATHVDARLVERREAVVVTRAGLTRPIAGGSDAVRILRALDAAEQLSIAESRRLGVREAVRVRLATYLARK